MTIGGIFYLATPFSNYRDGEAEAYREACRQAAFLHANGVLAYSPIAHSYGLLVEVPALGGAFAEWERFDRTMIGLSAGFIVCQMPGWDESTGIAAEQAIAQGAGVPVIFMEPFKLPETLRRN